MPHGGIPEGGQLLQTHGIKWGDGSDSTADSAYFDTKGNLVINVGQGAGSIVLPGGAVLRSGAGAPSNSLGDNGDFYLDKNGTANACFYQRSGGVWSLLPTSGGSPNGAAGGSLTGNYPSPFIAALAVSTNMLASGAVTSAAIASGAVASFHIQSGAVGSVHLGSGQVGSAHYAPSSITAAKADSTIEKVANKGVANGYAGLDSGGHVPVAQLASGTPSSSTYVRGDGTWAAGTATPLSGLTDVNIASPTDGDVLTYHSSAAKWQNDSRPERTFEFFGGSKTGNLAAQTAAFNAFRTWADTNGGGKLVFGIGTYQHMPRMELGTHQSLRGQGMFTSRIQFDSTVGPLTLSCTTNGTTTVTTSSTLGLMPGQAVTGTNIAASTTVSSITNATTFVLSQNASGSGTQTLTFESALIYPHVSTNTTTDPNAYGCEIEYLWLDCTQLSGWGTSPLNAIMFSRNPRFGSAAAADSAEPPIDANHVIRDVYIQTPPQDGVVALSMGGMHWENIYVTNPGRYGYQPPFDSSCFNLTSAFSRKEGFFITGSPVRLTSCKAFSSGNDVATRANGYAFHLQNIGQGETQLVNCEAQDNYAGGYFVDSCANSIALVGCSADSNSVSSAGTYPAFDLFNSPGTQLSACKASERMADGTHSYQTHAVSVRGTSTGVHLEVRHSANSGATISTIFGAIDSGSSVAFADVNNLQGFQSNSSASFSPDFTLGGTVETLALATNATVGAPANGPYPVGTRAEFIFQQDGTGGRTITWNAIYKNTPTTNTAASAYTVARFRFDGTNWIGL